MRRCFSSRLRRFDYADAAMLSLPPWPYYYADAAIICRLGFHYLLPVDIAAATLTH